MRLPTFRGGVHPPEKKELSKDSRLSVLPLPERVYVFLANHAGVPAKPLVNVGDSVKTGQLIAEASGFISANLHSPLTGEVKEIAKYYHPTLSKPDDAIVIEKSGEEEWELLEPAKPYEQFEPEEIIQRIKDAGIVGLGGAMFPTNVKLSPPKEKKIDLLILNGAECEPYLTIDYRYMLERSEGIVRGILAIMRALKVDNAVIGIEDNKQKAIEQMEVAVRSTPIQVKRLKTKYPQGAEKQLIYALTKRKVPSGGLPLDVGVVVDNIGTAFAVYEAVELGHPLVERGVTLTGEGIKKPLNVISRIGVMASELIEYAGGAQEIVERIVFGGPMMGITVPKIDVPTVKGTSGITLLMKSDPLEEFPCIRCGKCATVCPMNLQPFLLNLYGTNRLYDKQVENGLLDCIECGSCSYACPANIELVKNFKLNKKVYRSLKGGAKK
ncbi:electron transport complex subunit RsxC [Mesotoga prima]|uniref:electron transport complex subunit RsxC n=1 Tax=Mesotoga prima TaxID=1184387 RepID=UPI001BD631BD|nr:electron transport complex subunit RsxC [Mesotoga prima]HOP37522.1 electron transport complex subunit RsxC [Mesotoga prima]HPJ32076.1 electron transport complex subunit RsxC [Mesotoga prima]